MKTNRSILLFFLVTAAILAVNAGFNYWIDAHCFYHCPDIDVEKKTTNIFYRAAQRIVAYPQTKILIVGSSRGEVLLPDSVEQFTGSPTLNVSVAGADLTAKTALIHFAKKKASIDTVIWFADYFELLASVQDSKMRKTPALRQLVDSNLSPSVMKSALESLQSLIDHNTTSASMHFLKKPPGLLSKGGVDNQTADKCASEEFQGSETPQSLQTKVNVLYQSYVNGVIAKAQDVEAQKVFRREIEALAQKGVRVVIVVNPYHPDFLARLKAEHPKLYSYHQEWASFLQSMQQPNIELLNFMEGIPGTASTPKYWNDGVHFSCHSVLKMIQTSRILKGKS